MILALSSSRLKSWAAAAAIGICAAAFATPPVAQARGFGGFHGGMGGFRGGMGGFRGGMARPGFGGFQGGSGLRSSGFVHPGFVHPGVAHPGFMHPGFAGSGFVHRPGFVRSPVFFHHRFVDGRRFFFRHHRFVTVGFAGGYDGPYDESSSYDEPYQDQCFVMRRRVLDRHGYLVIRRTLVCG